VDAIRILVADDSADDRLILRVLLDRTKVSYELFETQDGDEAIDFLTHASQFTDLHRFPTPDLLLLDLKMPGKDGFDVLDWLRLNPAVAPGQTVILSGSELPTDVARAREMGAADYLGKPPSVVRLQQILSGVLTRRTKVQSAGVEFG
jgi:CheY-like chemotaxis protein